MVPPAEVTTGVNSKAYLLRFKLFNKGTYFMILVSLTAIMSKTFLVELNKYWRSSKFLLREHALIWNRDSDLFF